MDSPTRDEVRGESTMALYAELHERYGVPWDKENDEEEEEQ
jgi:hypothetical protein